MLQHPAASRATYTARLNRRGTIRLFYFAAARAETRWPLLKLPLCNDSQVAKAGGMGKSGDAVEAQQEEQEHAK